MTAESSIIECLLRYWENYVAGAAGKNLVVEVSLNINAIIKRVAFLVEMASVSCLFYACGMALTLLSKREDILSFCCS